MSEFQYAPLDLGARSFRLLRLLHGSDEDIECEIFEAVFQDEDLIPYEALSYAWGNLETPHAIKLNNKRLAITENLHVALKHLRIEDEDRIMWIDAVCIDQKNKRERGHQVQQMGDIYSRAEQVIFWLGPATPETDSVMSALKRLEHLSREHTSTSWLLSDKEWLKSWAKSQPGWNAVHIQQRNGLIQLLQRPWFERVWILQEVANARRAVVCVGDKVVASSVLALAPAMFDIDRGRSKHIFTTTSTLAIEDLRRSWHFQAVLDIMPGPLRRRSWWGERRDLYTLLWKFRGSQASEPRDMIYALLGISSDGPLFAESLRPDYTKPIDQLINDVISSIFSGLGTGRFRTMDAFLNTITDIPQRSFYAAVLTGRATDVAPFLYKARQEWKTQLLNAESLVAAASNERYGAEVVETLLDSQGHGIERFCNSYITATAIAAAIGNHQSGIDVIRVFHRRCDEKLRDKLMCFVHQAAVSDIGCGNDILKDFFHNQRVTTTEESAHLYISPARKFIRNEAYVWNDLSQGLTEAVEVAEKIVQYLKTDLSEDVSQETRKALCFRRRDDSWFLGYEFVSSMDV